MTNTNNLVASAGGTLCAELITLPICSTKTVYQTQKCHTIVNFRNMHDPNSAVGYILSRQGIRGFYNASVPAVVAQVFSTSSKFALYQALQPTYAKSRFREMTWTVFFTKVATGCFSGILASICTHPCDTARAILQNQQSIVQHWRDTPLRPRILRFYRGYSTTLGKVLLASSLYFPIYDTTQELLAAKSKHQTLCNAASAAISATISGTIIQPVEYLKTRLISGVPLLDSEKPFPGQLFRGLSLNLGRVIPHFVLTMTLTELFLDKLK